MAVKPFTFKLKDNSDAVSRLFRIACKAALDDAGEFIARDANTRAPIGDTGRLSKSYEYQVDATAQSVKVGSALNYAPYVELGTGPHYEKPPKWVENLAPRGHHDTDPWWYIGEDGEWHQGWFIPAQPHLRPAVTENADEIKDIFKQHLKKGQ